VTKDGGRLIVYEGINEAVQAAGGPAGYRRAGTQETREVSFGRMSGTTIGLSNYDPVKELNVIEQSLSLLDKGHDEEAMMNFICSLDPKERHAAVVLLREADKRFKKFNERLSDFISFFAPDNLARLNRWGEHPDSMDLRVERTHRMGLPRIEFRRHDSQAAVSPDAVMWNQQTDWIEFEG